MAAACLLIGGLQADKLSAGATGTADRVLHFPHDRYMGTLYIEDPCSASGYRRRSQDPSLPYGLDPKRLALNYGWDFAGFAQGDVHVPAGQDIILNIMLRLDRDDAGRLAGLAARQYQVFGADRCRVDPPDLSGLSALEPNDLCRLALNSLVRRPDADERVLRPIRHLTGLKVLTLYGTGITNKGMEYLKELHSLRAFAFSAEPFLGNEGLAALKALPHLAYLDLDAGPTDVGFKHLGQLSHLRWLRVRTGRIWGPGLAELAHLPHLERLCLWGTTPISDRHLQYLEGLTHLKSLTLWGVADSLTDASLASIGKLKDLEELYFIITAPRFTPAGLVHLKQLKNLRKVDFSATWVVPWGAVYGNAVVRQLADMPGLESIEGLGGLSPEGMKTLGTMRNLKCVHVSLMGRFQDYHGPTGVSYLAGLSKLEELALSCSGCLSDADLVHLESLGNLRLLILGDDGVTDCGMASLAKLHRLEHLTVFADDGGISKSGLNELSGLTNLRTLQVRVPRDAAPALDEIRLNLSSLTNLRSLDLAGFALQEDDFAGVSGLPQLERIMLQNNVLPETSLRLLKDLPALKRLDISQVQCSDGSGLACLAELTGLRDLTLRGRITDRALSQLACVTSAWSISAWTNDPIRPETVNLLKQTLPALEYIHLYPLPDWDKLQIKPSPKPQDQAPSRPSRTRRRVPLRLVPRR